MDEKNFRRMAIKAVVDYTNKHIDKTDDKEITAEDVYVVWQVKVLQNNKALLSTNLSDGMYYECTYSGDKDEMYVDCYKKRENFCVVGNLENAIIRHKDKLTANKSLPPMPFPLGIRVKVIDAMERFRIFHALPAMGLFPFFDKLFWEKCKRDFFDTEVEEFHNMTGRIVAVDFDSYFEFRREDNRYVYLIETDGGKNFIFYENGLAPLSEEKRQ